MSSEVMKGELPPSKEYKGNDVEQDDLSYFFSGETTTSRLSPRHEGEGWM